MASESSVADQSIDEHAEEGKVGDVRKCVDGEEIIFQPKEAAGKDEAENSKEVGSTGMASTFSEENLEPDDLSVSEEQHEKVGEVENSPQNSEVSNSSEPVVDIDEGTLQSEADDAHEMPSEVQEKSSDFIETSASQEPVISESKSEGLKDNESKPTFENERKSEEAPLVSTSVDISEDGNIVAETEEAANPAFSMDKTGIELIGPDDSNDETHVLVPAEVPTVFVPDSSETPEKNVDSTYLASIEVPVKDLEAASGSPEEQKSKESTEIVEPISNVSINDSGDEVDGSSSYEVKPTGVSQVVENKDDGLKEETTQPSFKIQEDLEANYNLVQTESDENVSQGVEVKKDDEIVEGGIETSTVPDDVPSLAIVSSEEEKASEPGVVVEEEGESSLESDNIDAVPKVAEISLEGENVAEEDELVDKEKIVSADAVERDLVDSITDPTEAMVSSDEVRTPIAENVNEALEVTSKELNIAPVVSEAFSEGDQIPVGEEKSDSLKDEVATSVETPNDITTPEEPLDQVIEEKKSENSVSETHSPSEDKLLDEEKDANEEAEDINLQSQANDADQTPRAVQIDFAEKSASQEPAFSKSKIEDLKDTEIKPTTENERKSEEAHLISTGVGISEDGNFEAEPAVVFKKEEETSLEDDNIGTVSKVAEVSFEGGNTLEGDKLVDKEEVNADAVERDLFIDPAEAELSSDQVKAPTIILSENEAPEVTSKEVNFAPEASDVPSEGDKISTGDEKSEGLKGETSTSMEAPNGITIVEAPLDQMIEEKKSESLISDIQPPSEDKLVDEEKDVNEEDKEISLQSQANVADQNASVVHNDFAETFTSQEHVFLESKNEDLKDIETQPTFENERKVVEAALASTGTDISEDENLEAVSQEAANSEFSKDKVGMELIKSEDSKDEIPSAVAPDAFEGPEKNDVDSTYPTSIVVPVKDLEVEFGSPEEQKPKEGTETKEPSSSARTIDARGEVVGSSYEAKPSGNAVVERKDDGLEIHENPEANPELAQTQSDENVSEGVEAKKDDEKVEGALETSDVHDDVPPLAKVSYEEEKAVEPGIVDEKDKTSLEGDSIGTVADVSLKGANVLEGNELVDKEKVVNSDAVETDLVGTFTDPKDAEVSSDQAKAPTTTEIVKEESNDGALEMRSKELDIATEASEFPSDVDTFSAGADEKSECLIVGDATSAEVPKDIIVIKESLDQLVEEKKNESLASEMAAQTKDKLVDKEKNVNVKDEERDFINSSTDATAAELSSEKVKAPEFVEEEKQALEETSKELNTAPEASEVTYEDDKLFAGEEKNGSLKDEAATSVEAPEDIITIKESHDQEIEEKKSETEAPVEDKLVDKEKNMNEKAEDRDLVDTSIDPTAAEVSSDQTKAYETVESMKEENNEQALEVTSKELNIASEATEVSLIGDEVSGGEVKRESSKGEDETLVEAPKNIKIEEDTPDHEGSKSEMEALAEDKLVDKEKDMNVEAEKTKSVDSPTDPSATEVFSEQVKVAETAEIVNKRDKEAPEVTSKEVNIAPEASEAPSEGDKVSTGDEKSEGLKGETSTSMEAPNGITIVEAPLDQVIEEKKSESLKSDIQPPLEDKLVDEEKDVNEEDKEINLQSQANVADQNVSVVHNDFAETFTSQEHVFSESKNEDLKDIETQPTFENERKVVEAALASTGTDISEDENLEAVSQEAANSEFSKDKVGIELINSEDSKDEIPTAVAPDAFEGPEKNVDDSTYPTSIVVPVKDLEVEFGSPEEQKPKEGTETKEPSSSARTIDVGGEVVGSSYEAKPSGNAVVERKDDVLEIHENPVANPELAQTQSDENVSEGVEAKKDDEKVEGALETSDVHDDVPPLAKVSYEEEKAVEPGIVDEKDKTSLEGDSIGTVADVSLKGANVLEGNELVDKEKVVNSDAVETDLVGTFTDPKDAEVSSDQAKAPTTTEIVKEESNDGALEMRSKELDIATEASEFPSDVDTFSAGADEKSECLIVGDATSAEVPKDIIVIKESLDQLVEEKKNESLASEMAAQTKDKLVDKEKNVNVKDEERDFINSSTDATAAELSSEKVKAPEFVEEEKQALEETSKELNTAPEASEVTYEDDKLFAGEEKNGSLKDEAATSVEAPEDIITIKESHDREIEEKKSETEAPVEDKLVDKEKNMNEKAEDRDLVDTSIDPTTAEVSSDQTKAYETVESMKEESNEQALEVTSKELHIASEATEVSLIGDEVSEGEVMRESSKGEDETLVEAPKNIKIAEDTPDQVIMQKKSEGSKSEMEALAEDKLVDKEKEMNTEAEKTESVDIPTYPSASEVFSEQVKVAETHEIVNESDKEAPELASKELNIAPEASEVPSEGDKVSLGEGEKTKSLKDEDAPSSEPPKDITTQEKSVDQLIEENKNESSKNKIEAPIETRDFDTSMLLPKVVKDIITSEAVQEKQDETSNDLSMEEKKANDSEHIKEEEKVEEALQHATDKPEKAESEKSKDENPIVSSDTVDAKLTKEVTKRESNIFSKVKRSIVKAKKAIFGKSPGTKTLSSEAKDENI